MTSHDNIRRAESELETALAVVQQEIRNYPSPVAGCDAQYNYLLGMRGSLREALRSIREPHFVPSPRELVAGSGMESR